MVATLSPVFLLLCMASILTVSWALPQVGFPHGNNPSSSARGQVFGTSQLPQQYPIIPYSYGYEVQDPLTNNYQNKAEIKTANGDVYGSYSVLMPDGYIYTTTYNSTKATGFVSRLVKTLAILPQQLAAAATAQSRSNQAQPRQATVTAAQPTGFQQVKSQPQAPQQQLQQAAQAQQQQHVNQVQFQTQLPQPQQPQQQLQLQQLQLVQPQQQQQVQSQQVTPQFLQIQQPLALPTELHGPFRLAL